MFSKPERSLRSLVCNQQKKMETGSDRSAPPPRFHRATGEFAGCGWSSWTLRGSRGRRQVGRDKSSRDVVDVMGLGWSAKVDLRLLMEVPYILL